MPPEGWRSARGGSSGPDACSGLRTRESESDESLVLSPESRVLSPFYPDGWAIRPDLRHSLRMTESSGIMSRRPRSREATGRSSHGGSVSTSSQDRRSAYSRRPIAAGPSVAAARSSSPRSQESHSGSHPGPRTDSPPASTDRGPDAPSRPLPAPMVGSSWPSEDPPPGINAPLQSLINAL
jgi:hypothetical protein